MNHDPSPESETPRVDTKEDRMAKARAARRAKVDAKLTPVAPLAVAVQSGRKQAARPPVATIFMAAGKRVMQPIRRIVATTTTIANPRQGPRPGAFRGG